MSIIESRFFASLYFQVLAVLGDFQRRLGHVTQTNAAALEATLTSLRSEGQLMVTLGERLMRGQVSPFSLDPGTPAPTRGRAPPDPAGRCYWSSHGSSGRRARTTRIGRRIGTRGPTQDPEERNVQGASPFEWADILSTRELELSCISQSHSQPESLRAGTLFLCQKAHSLNQSWIIFQEIRVSQRLMLACISLFLQSLGSKPSAGGDAGSAGSGTFRTGSLASALKSKVHFLHQGFN